MHIVSIVFLAVYSQVTLNSEDELAEFSSKCKANQQAPEIYHQMIESQLGKLHLDEVRASQALIVGFSLRFV